MQFFTRFVRGRRGNLATRAAFALGAALAFPDTQNAQAAGAPELGVWINHEGKGAVEIKQCGAALCGNIVWLKSQVNDQGQPLFDRRNPDESKRTRPICGWWPGTPPTSRAASNALPHCCVRSMPTSCCSPRLPANRRRSWNANWEALSG